MNQPATQELAAVRDALREWYDREQRDLPWRRTRDPYAIWVSEIMLQQTRVDAVIPYYRRFLDRFPDVASLADASEEDVLAQWSGLGYYRRARNLRQGASLVRERFGGRFPRSREEALTIPGIGRYTSAAVLSIAYDEPHAVVDGNVARVLTRVFALEPPEDSARRLELRAEALLDPRRPGDHNQAMMELGATVCTPQAPRCARCPLERLCRARRENRTEELPRVPAARATEHIDAVALLLADPEERILLERGRWRLLPHLWLPPILEIADTSALAPGPVVSQWMESRSETEMRDALSATRGLEWSGTFSHAITHHRLRFHVLRGRVPSSGSSGWERGDGSGSVSGVVSGAASGASTGGAPGASSQWIHPEHLRNLGVSSIVTKALRSQEAVRLQKALPSREALRVEGAARLRKAVRPAPPAR